MDRIAAITEGVGLRGHLDQALANGNDLFTFVVYNLPNRDCAALASNGELLISENGFERYKLEYIDPIVEILSDPAYADINIVAVIEVDSLPNLVTNLSTPECQEANGPGGYRDGIRYALNQLSTLPNVYSYVDIGNSGWLGWSSNFGPAVSLIGDLIETTDKGWNSVAGFVSNTSNYAPVEEPFLPDPTLTVGGQPIRSADFYEWNDYLEELDFVQDWRQAMIDRGAPETIGMLIDTGRNGWGGPDRPTGVSASLDVNTYVNESRIDRREHRGNWCNQPGGVGFRPQANPHPGVDAYVWVKPPGESDGIADPNFEQDPNDPNKKHDPMCDPNASNRYDGSVSTGALPNAPHAGGWFPEGFQVLLENAYPPL
ncbi:glycoside hydrolase family 6 protein [Microbulbifer thermotolerans]|nr:glycoside hydrolase family 6 protein [Microbulbifer thermotolerans]MCX2778102.1 glycoside hydrolase family 6 protein [Microbulbifer thermotolerans]MCX2795401.1 glycoside hydrolase family 6 protein [Microbulbifer thermotolerans]MCX2806228.1 glycoside hydrolase family 6 protein [Microbulbifer thermotolerans]MCX2832206.1 glycoside hydrolase family 6 protein [Microbulbifer thermotolerans]MCX2835459.1 glycoside hydrolase family 6 protein [Microbulbifer thermotolerans]